MALKDQCIARIEAQIKYTTEKILHYNADLTVACPDTLTHEQLFDKLFSADRSNLTTSHTKTLEETVAFAESRDKRSNDLCVQIGRSLQGYATRLTKFVGDQEESKTKYELEKAKLEDENNEKLEELAKNLDTAKQSLRRAKDHFELDERLQLAFQAVDAIEAEFRDFHEKNKQVTDKHLPFIEEVFKILERDLLYLMGFVDEAKRPDLENLYDRVAKWKAKLKTDAFIKERDEREKREYDELIEANKDKKGFKPPKPKVVDAKKAAIEWQEIFQKNYAEAKRPVVEKVISTGEKKLVNKSIRAFCTDLFQPVLPEKTPEEIKAEEEKARLAKEEAERIQREEEEAKKKKGGAAAAKPKTKEEEPITEALDPEDAQVPPVQGPNPKYPKEDNMFSSEYVNELDWVVELETDFRNRVMQYVDKLKAISVSEAKADDNSFVDMSLMLLDERLRKYYGVKGRIQTDIYNIRSGEITVHKKKYQSELKNLLDMIDAQTEDYNKVSKEIFTLKENHTKNVDSQIASLGAQTSLAALQGVQNSVKDKDFKYGEQTNLLFNRLKDLGTAALENLLKLNKDRLATKVMLENGGEYSEEEINWYKSMLTEIDQKIEDHKKKRAEMTNNLEELCKKRREEAATKFQDAYAIAIDELAARNGTGKVFGKTRRVAQEIVRTEISNCIRADQNMANLLNDIESLAKKFEAHTMSFDDIKTLWSNLRQKMMSFRNCAFFFGRYLAAFNDKSPLEEMPRVTYIEDTLDARLKDNEKADDDQRKVKELQPLEQIYYRGDKVKFADRIKDMETALAQEVAKLYVQQYAKYLGPDKTTDVLRAFVVSLRKEMEEFRITAIRQLRTLTDKFLEITPEICKALFGSIKDRYEDELRSRVDKVEARWKKVYSDSDSKKEQHLKNLRPGMAHPYNKTQLQTLLSDESKRAATVAQELDTRTSTVVTAYFETCNTYFQKTLNSFYFLLMLFDNSVMSEDFIKLPGDEEVEKPHLSLKKLMIMQQKGELKDTSSLRSIVKKWSTYPLEMFALAGKTFDFKGVDCSLTIANS